jgi:hypothetical protein
MADKLRIRLTIAELSREFRDAIVAGDHTRAQRVFHDYVAVVHDSLQSWPNEYRAPALAEIRALLQWAREATLIQRSLHAHQLANLQRGNSYRRHAASHRVQVNA